MCVQYYEIRVCRHLKHTDSSTTFEPPVTTLCTSLCLVMSTTLDKSTFIGNACT